MEPVFVPPFQAEASEVRKEIMRLEKIYYETPSRLADQMAMAAGQRISKGERTKENLKIIFHWKHQNSRFYESKLEPEFDRNRSEAVDKALKQANEAKTDCEAIEALLTLKGVGVPTASAILANIYPDRFTVIDQRALRALGVDNQEVAFYLLYNAECCRMAEKYRVSKRSLDRALWVSGKKPRRTSSGQTGP